MRLIRFVRTLRSRAISRITFAAVIRVWPEIPGERVVLVATLVNTTVGFALNLVTLWFVVWLVSPGLLGSTAAGMESLAQTIPATIVALFVFTLGALVGIAQLSINAYGHRAALMLVEDPVVAVSVIRPLVLAVAALLLAGQVPDSGAPDELVTSGFSALALLTIIVIVRSVGLLGATLLRYTAPLTFSEMVVSDVQDHLSIGAVRLVRWKVPMFEEMAKLAIRRGDSAALGSALQGLSGVVDAYVVATAVCPEARGMPFDDIDQPYAMYGWLGQDLREVLVRIGEDTLRQSAPSEDSDHAVDRLEAATVSMLEVHLFVEAKTLINGLIALGCTTHQVGSNYVNVMVRPAPALARIVLKASAVGSPHLAAYALAGWALLMAYLDGHFGTPDQPLGKHPNWLPGLLAMGSAPPWDEAAQMIASPKWQTRWANQIKLGPDFVLLLLTFAQQTHDMLTAGQPPPDLPSMDEICEMVDLMPT
jgi:hypothetical protein